MPSPDADLVVVGGGPAGSAAAITAAAAGHSVILLDRKRFPRDKPCGDGVTPRGVAMLERLGVAAACEATFHRADGFRIRTSGRSLRRAFPHQRAGLPDHALVARRSVLDLLLIDRARALGVRVLEGTEGVRPVWERGRVTGVATAGGGSADAIRGRIVVAADGATSRIAQALGVRDPSTVYGFALRTEMRSPGGDDRDLEIFPHLTLNDRTVPGYGWAFPLGDGVMNVGVGFVSMSRSVRMPLRQLQESFFAQVPEKWGLEDWRSNPGWSGWKLLMGLGRTPLWRPGILLAGDAAGAVRPTSGAGISKALRTGFLAGIAVDDALRHDSTDDLSAYEEALRGELGASYRAGRLFARAIARPRVMRAFGSAMTFDAGARLFEDVLSDVVGTDAVARDDRRIAAGVVR